MAGNARMYVHSQQPEAFASYTDYPQAATTNAKRALKWAEKEGWGSCGTAVGKARANQLAKREPISEDTISRMASSLKSLASQPSSSGRISESENPSRWAR